MEIVKPKVFVLMPFYNSEKTILRALRSVKKQISDDFNIELVMCNDGSTDGSMRIVEEFKVDLPTSFEINIIKNDRNLGIGHTRNVLNALVQAKLKVEINDQPGSFVCYLDADDEFAYSDSLKSICETFKATKAEICLTGFSIEYEAKPGSEEYKKLFKNAEGLRKDKRNYDKIIQQILSGGEVDRSRITSLGWAKCYSATFFQETPQVNEHGLYEDFVFMSSVFCAQKFTSVNKATHIFYKRLESSTAKRSAESFNEVMDRLSELKEKIEENSFRKLEEKASQELENFLKIKIDQYYTTLLNTIEIAKQSYITTETKEDKEYLDSFKNAVKQYKERAEKEFNIVLKPKQNIQER